MYRRWGKRPFDCVAAVAGLAILSPMMAVIGVCIWLEDRGSVIFKQSRVGKDEIPFTIWKFRTMPASTASVPSAAITTPTTTRVGAVIRRLSLDELPQLVNVLRGEMSLVGPRPALPSQTELIELRRISGATRVRPGMTGLAQIRSYDGMPDDEKAAHDGEYAESLTMLNDLSILTRTATYLLKPPPKY